MLDGASDRYGFVGGDIIEPLSTGDYTLVAEVTHVSSSATPIYDWDVTFTITDDKDVVTTLSANDCPGIMDYTHKYLGEQTDRADAEAIGYACATTSMVQGTYSVEATANMLGELDDTTMTLDSKVTDMITVNLSLIHI